MTTTMPNVLKQRQFSESKSKKDLKTLLDIVEPKLMVNRSIRSFLSNYNVRQWQQVIKYLLVYGTATLQEKHGNQILAVEELKELSRTAQARVVFNKGIPALSDALEQMRTQLHDFEREIDMNKVDLKEARKEPKTKAKAKAPSREPKPVASPAKEEAVPVRATEVVAPKTPVSEFGVGREDPRDTLAEKYRRRKLYGATKSKTLKKKPSSSWRRGDDLGRPAQAEEGCCEDEEYTPYPKWWDHPVDKSSKKRTAKPAKHTLDFALPCLSSYVHDPNVSEEDNVDLERDDFNVYDYLHTKYDDSPAPLKVPTTQPKAEADGAEEDDLGQESAPRAEYESNTRLSGDWEGTQVQRSMGAFYSDHWMQYFVDKHAGSPEAFERMSAVAGVGSSHEEGGADGTAAAVISELSKPFANKLEFSSSEFNEEDEEDVNPRGNWRYLKGKEFQHGGWVGEYDFTKKGRKPIRQWVEDNSSSGVEPSNEASRTSGSVKWDFDEILAL
ncbi:hypothetical protein HOP50_06g42250 [Chloropicon primus]|uniref:Uncharacterized protein n=1 Tax=Chloropicon primus TaxID=1764295 RepID=A0A5B8MQU8_9CHLO|nr:hypothetical protein A3770_06p42000 [Chloropicon primus]UPR00904.1 hypothetical protein HOP50_06g42250 [Chloropicon primus]|eukprot:QDZ21682.1 hypothetical protein A3770_06p42000 [Chloropicon primus]